MASEFEGVDEGTACTQSSFKTGGKAFLFAGMQGGRHKLMLKLDASLPEARQLAKERPEDFQVGNSHWVTARFTADQPLPARLWQKWLKESYELSQRKPATKKSTVKKRTAKKK